MTSQTASFPVSLEKWVKFELPSEMTEAEWNHLLKVLAVFKPGFVVPSDSEIAEAVAHAESVLAEEAPAEKHPITGVQPSVMRRDPEVKALVNKCLSNGLSIAQVRQECEKLFGRDRVPTATSISRYRGQPKPVKPKST